MIANEWVQLEEEFICPIAGIHVCCDIQRRMRLNRRGLRSKDPKFKYAFIEKPKMSPFLPPLQCESKSGTGKSSSYMTAVVFQGSWFQCHMLTRTLVP
jgi:hypothetical protein